MGDFFAGFLVSIGIPATEVATPTEQDREWIQALVEAGMGFEEVRHWILFENRHVPQRLGALASWALELTMLEEEEEIA